MPKKLQDFSSNRSAVRLSGLNEGLRALIAAIYENQEMTSIGGDLKETRYFFNHSDNRDPSTNGGELGGHVTVRIYYQPASLAEYKAWETIDYEGFLSGRRRLAVRIEDGIAGGDQIWAFYLTNHPKVEKGKPKNNAYGIYTPVNMSA